MSEAACYTAGMLATDGYIDIKRQTATLKLHNDDRQIVEAIRDAMSPDSPVNQHKDKHADGTPFLTVSIRATSAKLVSDLAKLGIVSRKTHTVPFTVWPDDRQTIAFARGCLDGDGSIFISTRQNTWRVSFVGNHLMVDGFATFIRRLTGIEPGNIRAHRNIFCLTYWRQHEIQKIVRLLYEDATIAMPRKQVLANQIMARTFKVYRDWSKVTLEELEGLHQKLGSWLAVGRHYGASSQQVKSLVQGLRVAARRGM